MNHLQCNYASDQCLQAQSSFSFSCKLFGQDNSPLIIKKKKKNLKCREFLSTSIKHS